LADGTPFFYSDQDDGGFIWPGSLRLTSVEIPTVGPSVIHVPSESAPSGIRQEQTLFVDEDGVLNDNFKAGWGSSVVVTGGTVGDNFEAAGARVAISGGTIGRDFGAFHGSIVTISGGTVGDNFYARKGSVVEISGEAVLGYAAVDTGGLLNISGGSINQHLRADPASKIDIAGGVVDTISVNEEAVLNISGGIVDSVGAFEGAQVNISGGLVHEVQAFAESSINVFGTSFKLSGTDITASLIQNVPFVVADRGVVLSGRLADGSAFDFNLEPGMPSNREFFVSNAMLAITLVLPGDFNVDGIVDAADYVVWRGSLGSTVSTHGGGADGNFDGHITQADYEVWRANFGQRIGLGGGGSVGTLVIPEPNSAIVISLVALVLAAFRRRM
jgi:hypothetical protein